MRRAGAKFTDPKQYDGYDWGAKQKIVDDIKNQFFAPWNLEIDGYILKLIDDLDLNSPSVSDDIESIRTKSHLSLLHAVSVGWVKNYNFAYDDNDIIVDNNSTYRHSNARVKAPVYADAKQQSIFKKKYPWAKKFMPDPLNESKTNVEISCVVCGGSRIVHLSDLFIAKKCIKCKNSKR